MVLFLSRLLTEPTREGNVNVNWSDGATSAFIDGSWQDVRDGGQHEIVNPFDESVYATSVLSGETDVDRAVLSAKKALGASAWSRSTLAERVAACRRLGAILESQSDELATHMSKSMGAPLSYLKVFMLGSVPGLIEMYIDAVESLSLQYVRSDRHGNTLITRRPVGVVAAIVPWNAPLRSEIKKVVPGLLAGNAVVLKPDPQTPWAALALAEAAMEAGIPPGVLNVVLGGAHTGEALISHPLVNKIAFTGSTQVGRMIGAKAGDALKRVQLELGGKSAAVVLEDVDVSEIVDSLAAGVFANAGQMCVANSRILVHASRYSEVVDALSAQAEGYTLGDPFDQDTTMGPLVSQRQRDRVLGFIDAGRAEGVTYAAGGAAAKLPQGYFVEPTVAAGVESSMTLAQEEIFGPVASVISFDSEAEAIAIANDSRYGLGGAVYSSDSERALAVASHIRSGFVSINRFGIDASGPFGGMGMSGIGREHGPESFESYLEYVAYPFKPGDDSIGNIDLGALQ